MKEEYIRFGIIISRARRKKGLMIKECAPLIMKEDGNAISAQYLSDIESGRRNPPSELIVNQLSDLLNIPIEVLYFYAGIFPKTLKQDIDQEQIVSAYHNFVKALS